MEPFRRGHFPAGDPATHARSLPYARALGLCWDEAGAAAAGAACLRLPYGPRVRSSTRPAVDLCALLGLVDQSCSAAVYVGLDAPALTATLDLRVEFAAAPDEASDIVCTARTTWIDDVVALVRAEAVSVRSGATVCLASSAYALGSHPGGVRTPPSSPVAGEGGDDGALPFAGFSQMLALQHTDDGLSLPFHPRFVGATSLPALHGGATAAALAMAALDCAARETRDNAPARLLSLSVRYLHPALALPLHLRPQALKSGARASFIGVDASQGTPPKRVAQAEALFVGLPKAL